MAALRVVTWNIRAAIGTGPFPDRWWRHIDADRLRAVGAFLSSLDPDIVALQEVALVSRASELVDNAGDLARQLDMHVRYGAVRTFAVTDDDATVVGAGLFGNALLSRARLDSAATVALPMAPLNAFVERPETDHPAAGITYADAPDTIREPRCLLLGTVAGLRVGTVHLSHVGSGERLLQAGAVAAAFGDASPAVLLGDLNAAIGAPELAPLSGWTDAFVEPDAAEARISTVDGWRIDHVMVRGASVSPARVLRKSDDLSDHFPVLAEVSVP